MKKICLLISSGLLISSTVFAATDVNTNDVKNAIEHVNEISFSSSKETENIQQFNKTIENAKSKNYIAAVVNVANFISIVSPEYTAFSGSKDLDNMTQKFGSFAHEIRQAAQNYQKFDVLDQHLKQAHQALQSAWDYRVTFLNGESDEQKAYEFNYLLNYLTVNGVNLTQKNKDIIHAQALYTQINTMAYTVPMEAFKVYDNAQNMVVDAIYKINQDQVISSLQQLQTNAKILQLSQATNDIKTAINGFLDLSYSFKFLGKTIEIKLIPIKVQNMVHDGLQKSGFNDAQDALTFLLSTDKVNIPVAANYTNILKSQSTNVFARLMVTLSKSLAQNINKHLEDHKFSVSDEQAYYVITYQLSELLNKRLV